jgi:hypothetical protein
MMKSEIDQLRSVVRDEAVPVAERREAATLLVELAAKAVPTVTADDPEVRSLTAPWPRETEPEVTTAAIFSSYSGGMPSPDALATVQGRWVLRSQLAAVLDVSLPELERLETVRAILAGLPEGHALKLNGATPEKLLTTVDRPDAQRQYMVDGRYEYRPVSRPPVCLDDVWAPPEVLREAWEVKSSEIYNPAFHGPFTQFGRACQEAILALKD